MSTSRVTLDDQTLLELYTKFQEERRSLGEIYPLAPYDDFVARGSYQGVALPVAKTAQAYIRETTNTLNRFCYYLHSIIAWQKVFESSTTEVEKTQALFEFLFPITSHSICAPYSIKQVFIKSIYHISHETNRFCDPTWNAKSRETKPKFDHAKKLAKHFGSWPKLAKALSKLDDTNFRRASDDYRNRFNHSFPRRIEIGQTLPVQGTPFSFVGDAPPLLISDLIPLLDKQYKAALKCHEKYIGLIKEQNNLWPKK